jgi:protein phosphatase 1G
VAEFVSRNFEEAFRSSPYYKQMNYEMALQETFLRMDDLLMTPEGKMQIVEINK